MKIRGKGFRTEAFFSFCSRHRIHDENCHICNTGTWENIFKYEIGSILYKLFPRIWRWNINRK